MEKIVYIIPGYGETHLSRKAYGKLAKAFESRGIMPIHVKINWHARKPRRFRDYVVQFLKQYKNRKNEEAYVLGFSYGATIAFLSEPKTNPSTLILCSLSPYFSEDLEHFKPSWLKWFRKNFTESDYVFNKLAPKIKSKTFLFVGDKEGPEALRRAKDAKRKIKGSKLTIIKKTKHNIGQKEYLSELNKFISGL